MSDYLDREHEELYCGLIRNCIIDYGIRITPVGDGRGRIEVDPTPIRENHDGEALREFMTSIALSWMNQLETIPLYNYANDNN